MNRDELLTILRTHSDDPEMDHSHHDDALLAYINDSEVTHAFWSSTKWYA